MSPVLIAVGAVGQSRYRVQQIDPREDSIHMGHKNWMKPAVSDKLGRGRGISGGVIHANGFVREFL